MIDSKELRIGNWVSDIHASPSGMWPVRKLNSRGCVYGDKLYSKYENLKPIVLSPELLEKCGFNRLPLSSVNRWYKYHPIFGLQLSKGEWYLHGYKHYPQGVKYLHQLQNLHYFLAGEELNINLSNQLK